MDNQDIEHLRKYLDLNPDKLSVDTIRKFGSILDELRELRASGRTIELAPIDWGVPAETKGEIGVASGCSSYEDEQPESYNIVLTNIGRDRVSVIKAICEYTYLSLKECTTLINILPVIILTNISESEASEFKSRLELAGATILIYRRSVDT